MKRNETISIEEYRKLFGVKGHGKYHNVRTLYKNNYYDSKAEANYAAYLDLLIKAGEVISWERQVKFKVGQVDNYIVDFVVKWKDETVCVDVKGKETPKFRRDKKWWKIYGVMPLHIVKRKGNRWETEIVESELMKQKEK